MLVGCQQSGALATLFAKSDFWIRVLHENILRWNIFTLSFAIPDVHYHAEYDGRYYIVLRRLTGQTLTKAWPNMNEVMKQHYVPQVANICKELATWQADSISGVNGQYV